MLLEITGTGLENKGGQLMMQAVVAGLAPLGARFAMNPRVDAPPSGLVPLGVRPLVPPTANGRPDSMALQLRLADLASRAFPQQIARLYEAERRHHVRGLVDVSGYAFGDHFSALNIALMVIKLRHCKRRGLPAVMLPQMLGPFDKPEVARHMRELLPLPDLLYVRDATSLRHLEKLAGPNGLPPSVRRAPDLTIFETPDDADDEIAAARVPAGYVGLVPNVRMLDRGDAWRGIYLDRLATAARAALAAGRQVRVIVHEQAGEDAKLAAELTARLDGAPGEPVSDDSPLVLKAIIKRASCVVSSRFHSIVAALSSGVPAVALGWSHKYEEILGDFGVGELLHRADDGEAALASLVAATLEPARHAELSSTILDRRAAMADDAAAMWREVAGVLGLTPPRR